MGEAFYVAFHVEGELSLVVSRCLEGTFLKGSIEDMQYKVLLKQLFDLLLPEETWDSYIDL